MALVDLDARSLGALASEPGLLLVECRAQGCAACRLFGPVFEAVAARHPEHTFGRVDVTSEEGLDEALGVEQTPTLMVYRDGTLLFRQAGNYPEAELESIVTQAAALDMDVVRADIAAAEDAASRGVETP